MKVYGTSRDYNLEASQTWDTGYWQFEGWITLDSQKFGLFRIKYKKKVPDAIFPKMTELAKNHGGTWWGAAHVWIIPQPNMQEFTDFMLDLEDEIE